MALLGRAIRDSAIRLRDTVRSPSPVQDSANEDQEQEQLSSQLTPNSKQNSGENGRRFSFNEGAFRAPRRFRLADMARSEPAEYEFLKGKSLLNSEHNIVNLLEYLRETHIAPPVLATCQRCLTRLCLEQVDSHSLQCRVALTLPEEQTIFNLKGEQEDDVSVFGHLWTDAVRVMRLDNVKFSSSQSSKDGNNQNSIVRSPLRVLEDAVWSQYAQEYQHGDLTLQSNGSWAAKHLLRAEGVPFELRRHIWPLLANISIMRSKGPIEYADLVKTFAHKSSISASQIEKDLRRTFPHNSTIQSDENIAKLRNVLVVYSFVDPAIGYCQSMNFIAALLLLHLSEEDAFWALTRIIEDIMPAEYYTRSMLGVKVDQKVLAYLLDLKFPAVSRHLASAGVDLNAVAVSWFLCLFVTSLEQEGAERVLEIAMFEGDKVLFRLALALFKIHERAILAIDDFADLYLYLQEMARKTQFDTLLRTAFSSIKLTRLRIKQLRELYQPGVRRDHELAEQQLAASGRFKNDQIDENVRRIKRSAQQFKHGEASSDAEATIPVLVDDKTFEFSMVEDTHDGPIEEVSDMAAKQQLFYEIHMQQYFEDYANEMNDIAEQLEVEFCLPLEDDTVASQVVFSNTERPSMEENCESPLERSLTVESPQNPPIVVDQPQSATAAQSPDSLQTLPASATWEDVDGPLEVEARVVFIG